jgi:type IV pilus assembly protein PilO
MLNELRDLDPRDLGSASPVVRGFIIGLIVILIGVAGYMLVIKDKRLALERAQLTEGSLRQEFEEKQQKAANLDNYKEQLAEMQELLRTMLRQLPGKTEMDKLLVDVSQTALAAGIQNELFQPGVELVHDFYAETPIAIRMKGSYHEFGEFISGVASLPRVVILTMHDIALRRPTNANADPRLTLEGVVKTYRYVEEEEFVVDEEVQGP